MVDSDEDGGALVELANEVEEQLTARLREGQIAELVEDEEVEAGELIGVNVTTLFRSSCWGRCSG